MLSAYDLAALIDIPFIDTKFISHALEKERESHAWELWKSIYPCMITGQIGFISFDDYKNKLYSKTHKYTNKTKEEIEEEFGGIIKGCKRR